MQKKILALAVAGLVSSAAFAESNVSIYGIVDAGFASIKTTSGAPSTSVKAIDDGLLSSSRIGFKGTEDLGGGTSALFVLEYALGTDDTTGINTARQQLVGLKGSFGTVVAGRANTLGASFYNGGYNAFFGTQLDSYAQIGVGGPADRGTKNFLIGAGSRANNAFGYISPSFSGVTLGLNYAFNPTAQEAAPAAGDDQATAVLFSVDYANGPIKVGYVNASHDTGVAGAANKKLTEDGLGISYDMKVVKLGFSHLTNKVDGGSKNKGYQISVSAPVGAGTVLGQYASYAPGSVAGVAQAKDNGFALAYLHPMSKRTTAYAGYEAANNKTTGQATAKQTTIGVGIRHKF